MDGNQYEPIRKYKKNEGSEGPRYAVLALMIALVVIGAIVFVMSFTGTGLFSEKKAGGDDPAADGGNSESQSESEEESTSETEPLDPNAIHYKYVDMGVDDIGIGDLVLIDADHPFTFKGVTVDTLYGNKNSSYKINGTALSLSPKVINELNAMMERFAAETGFTHCIITSAYRSFDTQKSLYESNPKGAAKPGCSDYHSSASFMLQGYIDDNSGIFNLSNRAEASWLKQNAEKYGFTFRFPTNKKAITGYSFPWQMRYVGVPHSTFMKENDLCLEEYLERLAKYHKYSADKPEESHLFVNGADGAKYEIFYVVGPEEGYVKLPVPSNREYTVSGDNIGGFIVTILIEEAPEVTEPAATDTNAQ